MGPGPGEGPVLWITEEVDGASPRLWHQLEAMDKRWDTSRGSVARGTAGSAFVNVFLGGGLQDLVRVS